MKKSTTKISGKIKTTGPASEPVEGGIGEIDFGIASSEPAKKSKSKYPIITGPNVASLADRIIELQEKFDAVEDPLKAAKQDMIQLGLPQYFDVNIGMIEPPSSMIAWGTKGGGTRVTFKNQFTPGEKAAIESLLGPEVAAKWFKQKWVIKINGDVIPPAVAPALVSELKAVMNKFGVLHAMEVKQAISPIDEFAVKRHAVFDAKTNLAIHKIVPQYASVSTKGVR